MLPQTATEQTVDLPETVFAMNLDVVLGRVRALQECQSAQPLDAQPDDIECRRFPRDPVMDAPVVLRHHRRARFASQRWFAGGFTVDFRDFFGEDRIDQRAAASAVA